MAGPTTANTFTRVVVGLLSVLLLAAFSFAVYFFGLAQRSAKELEEQQSAVAQIIAPGEENSDRVQRLLQDRPGGQSLLGYLASSWETAMARVAGEPSLTPSQFTARLDQVPGAEQTALLALLQRAAQQAQENQQKLQATEQALAQAQADLQQTIDRLAQLERDHAAELDAKDQLIAAYRAELEQYRSDVSSAIDRANQRVDAIRRDAAAREAALQKEIARLEQDVLVQRDMIEQLRGERQATALRPQDEAALVDAQVIGASPAEGVVFLNVGRKQRVVLGMTFQIYADPSAIRPDEQGAYPPGKATVEVIRINDTSCAARIVRQARGASVSEGDVAANALYDPNKRYTFLVFGVFDVDQDGSPAPQEANAVKALIQEWGGQVVDELTGAVDFLVLGQRPILPPEPPLDSPPAVMRAYITQRQLVERYDELFRTASQTGIPVLNVNRLYTLTGLDVRR